MEPIKQLMYAMGTSDLVNTYMSYLETYRCYPEETRFEPILRALAHEYRVRIQAIEPFEAIKESDIL